MAIGAVTIVVIVAGLAIVEANTGPFPHEARPASHATSLEGTYLVEQGSASPICGAASEACEPSTVIEVTIAGLPHLDGDLGYAAELARDGDTVPLGSLEASDDGHRLAFEGPVDGDAYEDLRIGLAAANASAPDLVVQAVELPTSGGDEVEMAVEGRAQLAEASGEVSLAQIGAVEIAVTAEVRIEGLPATELGTYHAWLVDDDASAWTSLGEIAANEGNHGLDARQERVRLADQDRFLVTLEAGEPGARPGGFAVVETPVDADRLLG